MDLLHEKLAFLSLATSPHHSPGGKTIVLDGECMG
jgi:hypothetical protein